jgi:NADH:ubiquinone oxidoreductase subunit E
LNVKAKTGPDPCKCCECGEESEEELLRRIGELAQENRDKEGSLIQVLHMAQTLYGCLPMEVQQVVADGMRIPHSTVSGVVSFYSFFTTEPRESTPSASASARPVMCAAAKKSWPG